MPEEIKKFRIGLEVSGKIQFVLDTLATDFKAAAHTWAHITGHLDPCWRDDNSTYFGWPVVETTEDPQPRKSKNHPFQY